MISMKELLGSHNINDFPHSTQVNMENLLIVLNEFRAIYGKPMIVTSGIRTPQDQRRIYGDPKEPLKKIPMSSAHLIGLACDFKDSDGKLDEFCLQNLDLLENLGLYLEHPDATPGWCHLQLRAPRSGKRVFYP